MAAAAEEEELTAGPLTVLPDAYTVRAGGEVLPLTPRELELLAALMRRPDEVLTRTALYERCWGHAMDPADRAVDVYVRKLRAKLDHALPAWRFIHTHHRLGYRFSAQLVEEGAAGRAEDAGGDGAGAAGGNGAAGGVGASAGGNGTGAGGGAGGRRRAAGGDEPAAGGRRRRGAVVEVEA